MQKAIQNVLKKINDAGYEAYVVGGYPRDWYLGRELFDIDINTSAKPVELKKIFPQATLPKKKYGSVILHYRKLSFEITTFRREKTYCNHRKPCVFEYITDLREDLLRRDFTINTLCMDQFGNLIDFLGAKKDLNSKMIKTVKNAHDSLKQDALRILRAVRFATVLDFKCDSELKKAILKNRFLLEKISMERKKEELDKIFISKNVVKGVDLLLSFHLDLPLALPKLKDVVIVRNYMGIWAQLDVVDVYPFNRQEKKIIKGIQKMLQANDFSDQALYYNGLYVAAIAAEIKKYDREQIVKQYNDLPIKAKSDIRITGKELKNHCQDNGDIAKLFQTLERRILKRELANNKKAILNYLRQKNKL